MKKIIIVLTTLLLGQNTFSCTNIIVTKGASKDGSAFLFYTCDGEFLYHLKKYPAKDYKKGEFYYFKNYKGEITGKIPQVKHTYATIGSHINEFQVAIGETTFTGREELINHSAFINYWNLMHLALERAKTAKEAVNVITSIVDNYGYASSGETFSIVDKNEAWLLEMIGTGDGGKGAVWVAVKVPDGMVTAHANKARIGEFPLNDPENCLYSKNVISFAVEKGYYNPKSGKPFKFNDVYCPATPAKLRYCSSRVWSIFNRVSPSLHLSMDYNRGVVGAKEYPLYIKPDKKIGIKDMFNLVRDHYEGTSIDMTKGFDAGPFGNPNRLRPLNWSVDSVECAWERPISISNASFSFIAQLRNFMPDNIGGVLWFSDDDTYTSCYLPIYNSVSDVPKPYKTGDFNNFSWSSAWWTFNFVSNYANIRYSDMIKDIQAVQDSIESDFIKNQKIIEEKALNLEKQNKNNEVTALLTNYDNSKADMLMKRWKELGYFLITKYNDGYVKDKNGYPHQTGYPEEYKRAALKNRPSVILPDWNQSKEDNKATDF
jgi:dipeptidase